MSDATLCDYCGIFKEGNYMSLITHSWSNYDIGGANFHVCPDCDHRIDDVKMTFKRGMAAARQRLDQQEKT